MKDEKILVSTTRLLMMKMSQFDSFLSPLEVFDVDHWNLKGAALALIFLVLGLANTIVGLMETWLEKKHWFFIINKAMFTCSVGRILVGNLWKSSWRCKKKTQEKSKNCCIFLHIKVAVVGTPDENHGLENWKIQAHKTQELLVGSLRKFDERLVDFFAMGSCKNVKFERLGPQSFCNGNFSVFFWWEYRRFLWSNGGKSNSFKRLNTTLTMSREPWWWAAQLV